MKYKNPKVKTEWTDEELDLIAQQLDKYWRVVQGERALSVFTTMDSCLICKPMRDYKGDLDCIRCPLGDGNNNWLPCEDGDYFYYTDMRWNMTEYEAAARLAYLEKKIRLSGAGIEIYEEEIE